MLLTVTPFPYGGLPLPIPWFSWANRGEGEMRIWVDEA